MNSIVDEIKSRVDIVDLISQYVQLKKRGTNYFGLCPFHSEKTPSFSVNPKGQFFHCFGCGESGDVITFFMKIENLEFKDAIKELAERYNIDIKTKETIKKNPLIDIHEYAADYFFAKLKQNEKAKRYIEKRKIDKETINSFKIGYAPNSNELFMLLKKEFSEEDIIKSGIFVKTQKGVYNRFADRIIFPIRNHKGSTIAFGGRAIDNDKTKAKYINSPETAIFSKQKILYGLFEAMQSAKKISKIIITEGYMDCIRLHSFGIKNAVATLGTALSKYHIATIKRYTDTLIFNYDADDAGFRAMTRSAKTILSSNIFSYVVTLDNKEDPDSFILKYGKDAYLKKIAEAKDYFDYLIDYLKNKYDINKPQNRLKIVEEIKPSLMGISDATMRTSYISKAAKALNVSEDTFSQTKTTTEFFKNINKEDAFLSLLIKDIELMGWIEDFEEFKDRLSGKYKELYSHILNFYLSGEEFKIDTFTQTIENKEIVNLAYELASIEHTEIESKYERRKVFLSLVSDFEKEHIKQKLNTIKEKLKKNPSEELLNEYNILFLKLKEIVS